MSLQQVPSKAKREDFSATSSRERSKQLLCAALRQDYHKRRKGRIICYSFGISEPKALKGALEMFLRFLFYFFFFLRHVQDEKQEKAADMKYKIYANLFYMLGHREKQRN